MTITKLRRRLSNSLLKADTALLRSSIWFRHAADHALRCAIKTGARVRRVAYLVRGCLCLDGRAVDCIAADNCTCRCHEEL